MDPRTARHIDQLRKRREQVAVTLRHLGKEQSEVEHNTEWLNRAAYERRSDLLARLFRWYVTEMDHIDKAFARVKLSSYARCAVCGGWLEELRLDAAPESEVCAACRAGQGAHKHKEEL